MEMKFPATIIGECYILSYQYSIPDAKYFSQNKTYYYNVNSQFGFTPDLNSIGVRMKITVSPTEDHSIELVSLEIHMEYYIQSLKEYIIDEAVNLPEQFWGWIINTTLGTLRGILISKSVDTLYGTLVIPFINIQNLLPSEPVPIPNFITQAIPSP